MVLAVFLFRNSELNVRPRQGADPLLQRRHRVFKALYLAARLRNDTSNLIDWIMDCATSGPAQVKDFANCHYKHFFVVLGTQERHLSTLRELDSWALKMSCRITSRTPIDELDRVVVETARRSLQVSNLTPRMGV